MSDEITELFVLHGLTENPGDAQRYDAALWPFAPPPAPNGPAQLMYLGRLEYEKGFTCESPRCPLIRRHFPPRTT